VIRFLGNILKHPLAFLKSFWIFGWGARTPILLVMQTAENNFQFNYKRRWWRLGKKTINSEISPESQKIPSYIPIANEVAKRMGEKINGQPMSAWTEVLFDISSTAHILGGCAMSDSAADGVVDFTGQLHGYPNLYVVDGSNVPVNLGVNPALTITAIAEYIMSQVPDRSESS
jgi:cholesterol oxidase